jgi:hypothetical protein
MDDFSGRDRSKQRNAIAASRRLFGDPRGDKTLEEQMRKTELAQSAQSMILHSLSGGAFLAVAVDCHEQELVFLREAHEESARASQRQHEETLRIAQRADEGLRLTDKRFLLPIFVSFLSLGASLAACIIVAGYLAVWAIR